MNYAQNWMHIVDDFGSLIPVCCLTHDCLVMRHRFFDEGWDL
jgi:hypothetical protein